MIQPCCGNYTNSGRVFLIGKLESLRTSVWPQKGMGWSLSYVGRDIQVPYDVYDGNLREVNIVRAFLPTALVAVHVDFTNGLGI